MRVFSAVDSLRLILPVQAGNDQAKDYQCTDVSGHFTVFRELVYVVL
jgi:hypothetical protein